MPRKFQHRRDIRNLFQISQQFWYMNSSYQRPDRIFLFCVQFECQVQTKVNGSCDSVEMWTCCVSVEWYSIETSVFAVGTTVS